MPDVEPPQPKRRRMSAVERRQKILSAAQQVFVERGFSGSRTKEIADRSGVTEAFMYRHFSSKEEMYQVSIIDPLRTGLAALAYDIEVLYSEYQDPIEFMNKLNIVNLRFYTEFASIQAVALYSELARGRELYQSTVRPILDRIGELIGDRMGWTDQGLDPVTVRRSILGAQWAVGLDLMLRSKRVDLESTVPRMTAMFTLGISEKQSDTS